MKDIEVKEVIISRLASRGEGVPGDPVRRILQVYEKSGELIAEHDPELEALPKTVDGLRNKIEIPIHKPVKIFTEEKLMRGSIISKEELRIAYSYLNYLGKPTSFTSKNYRPKAVLLKDIEKVFLMLKNGTIENYIKNKHNPKVSLKHQIKIES